jgi:hypothetical protein
MPRLVVEVAVRFCEAVIHSISSEQLTACCQLYSDCSMVIAEDYNIDQIYRVDPKFESCPRSWTENPYRSLRVDPDSGSTL